jgi:hypothetical protein
LSEKEQEGNDGGDDHQQAVEDPSRKVTPRLRPVRW